MKQTRTILLFFLFQLNLLSCVCAATYYLATNGLNTNNGTSSGSAFLTLDKAIGTAKAGDIIMVASGTYPCTATINITLNNITLKGVFSSPSTRPIFDFSSMALADANYGIQLKGSNCTLFGFSIKGAGDNGLLINGGSNNSIEFCDFLENRDSGLQIKAGGAHNRIVNCDSYYNVDAKQGNADGFADKLDEGGYNSFKGCRAYQNSDDGWDGLLGDVNYTPSDTIYNSWTYKNGYLKNGDKSSGNGNGFKLGGSQGSATKGPFIHRQIVINCLSVLNLEKGFDYNNNVGSMTLYNCTGYGNGGTGNFAFPNAVASGETVTLKNCLSYDSKYGSLYKDVVQETNSWTGGLSVTSADFMSLDDTQMLLPRKNDGSLPDITFMHLKKGSDLIDAGTNVGLPFVGKNPDLGCFEYNSVVTDLEDDIQNSSPPILYPNPSTGLFSYTSSSTNSQSYRVYNSLGELIMEANVDSGELGFDLSGRIPGTYFFQVITGTESICYKILLAK